MTMQKSEGSVTTGRRLTQRNSTPAFAKRRWRFDVSLFPLAHSRSPRCRYENCSAMINKDKRELALLKAQHQPMRLCAESDVAHVVTAEPGIYDFENFIKVTQRPGCGKVSAVFPQKVNSRLLFVVSRHQDSSINLHRWRKQNYDHKLLNPSLPWPHVHVLNAGGQRSQSWAERGPPALRAPYLRIELARDSTGWFEATRKSVVI